jgi:hypothetical protein
MKNTEFLVGSLVCVPRKLRARNQLPENQGVYIVVPSPYPYKNNDVIYVKCGVDEGTDHSRCVLKKDVVLLMSSLSANLSDIWLVEGTKVVFDLNNLKRAGVDTLAGDIKHSRVFTIRNSSYDKSFVELVELGSNYKIPRMVLRKATEQETKNNLPNWVTQPHCKVEGIMAPQPPHTPSPTEGQVGGDHYLKMGVQPLEGCYKNFGLEGLRATIYTYVNKYFRKKGDKFKSVEDLKKARHLLDYLIEATEKEAKENPNW